MHSAMTRRLTRMGLAEVAGRCREEATRWLERAGVVGGAARDLKSAGAQHIPDDPFPPARLSHLFGAARDSDTAPELTRRFPQVRDRILSDAEGIVKGRFRLFRHRALTFGEPIDWRLDPVSGRRAPSAHWTRLHPLHPIPGGDPKLVWELGRHQWMVTLGQAWRLTGDERYARRFAAALRGWLDANPPGWGIHWCSSLEAALRLISWSWAIALLRESPSFDAPLARALAVSFVAHAAHIERHLSRWFSPNTHLTGEALGLMHASAMLPWAHRAPLWGELGSAILRREAERQILPDGVYFEQSTCYQRYTIEILLHHLALSRALGKGAGEDLEARTRCMLDALLDLAGPGAVLPSIGDADGGRLLPLTPGAPEDARGPFAVAASWFRRPDYAWAAGGAHPDILWMQGAAGMEAFERLLPAPPARDASSLLPHGGYAILAGGWEPDAHRMIVDVGPLGGTASAGHGHADLLSVQCWAAGTAIIVDPGTYCYTTEPSWRDHFRSTAAHSTLTVDGRGQADPAGPFSWSDRPECRLRGWSSDPLLDRVDAEHGAWASGSRPVVHRRRVVFVKPAYWLIVDDLSGPGEHQVAIAFQFAPGVRVKVGDDLWISASAPGGRGVRLRAFATAPLRADLEQGNPAPPAGWVSPEFGRRVSAPMLRYRTTARLPLRVACLVQPFAAACAPLRVSPLMSEGPILAGLALAGGREFLMINDQEILIERRGGPCAA
ncbi:MAG TPA: alginate lyase family protein [Candidatus Polarisedimenticolia bacterium]|nr:alginate lyase family protein [Candidatus Polarisedimenticolia bacterium]